MESADLARALEPALPESELEPRPLGECPHCLSRFVQPLEWRERPGSGIVLVLRCPECEQQVEGEFSTERVREYDLALRDGRKRLRQWHRALAAQNMRDAGEALVAALERDLITADDFAR
jgi:hypothetical protein